MPPTPIPRRRVLELGALTGATALSGTALAACSSSGDDGGPGGGEAPNGRPNGPDTFPAEFPEVPTRVPEDSYAYDDLSAPVTMSLMLSGAFNGPRPKDPIKDFLEKKFNATIEFTSMVAEDMRNKLALTFTSGDAPDFIVIPAGLRDVANTLYEQGQLLNAADVLGLMPQASMYVTEAFKAWATIDEEMVGVPTYSTFPDVFNLYIRQDFLAKIGMDKPTNVDELMAYAKALKDNDPVPGKDGPWFMATGGDGAGWGMMSQVLAAFGHPGWNVKDGKINHPMIDGTTKAFLQFVNELRASDLLPPDWYTTAWEQLKSRTFNDQLGLVQYPGGNLATETYVARDNDFSKVEAWAPLGQISSPGNPEGLLPTPSGPGALFVFNAKLADDEAKLRRIAHMIDTFVYPNVNYWDVSQGGGPSIWGEDVIEVRFDEKTGLNVFTIPPDAPYHKDQSLASLADWQFFGYTLRWQTYEEKVAKYGYEWNQESALLKRWENFDVRLNLDPKPVQDLLTLGRKSEIQFALGQRSFDEWDAYVETWRKSGGQELLDAAAEQLGVQPA
ncbi:extracellular solute-binding protein [Microlunatus sp. GCM10028923]|uniref:extracellular solute-binding protein n=1 Tax=Microlunatus sp. GCM10028923 TaxID=3273400 RepID=UPI00360F1E4D